jgi:hypothetical protein
MNYFQKTILIIAIVILIISLIIIGFSIQNTKNNTWPPTVPNCPDYWMIEGSENNSKCINVKNLGTCQPFSGDKHLIMNFNEAPYNGSNGNCAKYTWANNCNLAWDGINYGVNNPCNTTATSTSSGSGNSYNRGFFSRFTNWFTSLMPSRQNFN